MPTEITEERILAIFDAHPRDALTVEQVTFYMNGESPITNRRYYGEVGKILRELSKGKKRDTPLMWLGFGHEEHSHCFAKQSTYRTQKK